MYIDAVSVVTLKGSRSKQPDLASGYLPVGYSIDSHLTRQVNSRCLWHSKVACTTSCTKNICAWTSCRPGAECSGVQGYTLKDLQFVVAFSEVRRPASRLTLTKKCSAYAWLNLQDQRRPCHRKVLLWTPAAICGAAAAAPGARRVPQHLRPGAGQGTSQDCLLCNQTVSTACGVSARRAPGWPQCNVSP
jgi:hypothetical protein